MRYNTIDGQQHQDDTVKCLDGDDLIVYYYPNHVVVHYFKEVGFNESTSIFEVACWTGEAVPRFQRF